MDTYICKMIRLSFLKTETNQPAKKNKAGHTTISREFLSPPASMPSVRDGSDGMTDKQKRRVLESPCLTVNGLCLEESHIETPDIA